MRHSGSQRCHLLLEPSRSRFGNAGWLTICGIHLCQIALDATVDFLHPLFKFTLREVAVMGIDRIEFAAINGHSRLDKELQLAARHNKLTAAIADAFAIVSPKVSNGLEIGRQPTEQPRQLNIPLRFSLQATT